MSGICSLMVVLGAPVHMARGFERTDFYRSLGGLRAYVVPNRPGVSARLGAHSCTLASTIINDFCFLSPEGGKLCQIK